MIFGNPDISLYNGKLPKGCELCRLGSKLVVFITGECGENCFYCPVSNERFGKPNIYANELKVNDLMEYIVEAHRMRALGAGITGGDPIIAIDKVVKLIRMLKDEFGEEFHIHLYTTGQYVTNDTLYELVNVGLDEIRFHPVKDEYLKAVEKALKYNIDVGFEIPAIPGKEDWIRRLIEWGRNRNVKFINLNELELTERNYFNLKSRGFSVSHGLAGVKGSFETAYKIIKENEECKLTIHYCSSVYKDIVETRTRFIRTAKFEAKPFEDVTPEGTIVKSIVYLRDKGLKVPELEDYGYKLHEGIYYVWSKIVDELKEKYKDLINEIEIVEEYPDRRIEVKREGIT